MRITDCRILLLTVLLVSQFESISTLAAAESVMSYDTAPVSPSAVALNAKDSEIPASHEQASSSSQTNYTEKESTQSPLISDEDWEQSASNGINRSLQNNQNSSVGESAARMGIGLVICLAIIVGVGWWLKKMQGRQVGAVSTGTDQLVVRANVNIGLRRSVSLVELHGQWVLVGQSERGIVPLGQGSLIADNHPRISTLENAPEDIADIDLQQAPQNQKSSADNLTKFQEKLENLQGGPSAAAAMVAYQHGQLDDDQVRS